MVGNFLLPIVLEIRRSKVGAMRRVTKKPTCWVPIFISLWREWWVEYQVNRFGWLLLPCQVVGEYNIVRQGDLPP